jgi:hypothetical protein
MRRNSRKSVRFLPAALVLLLVCMPLPALEKGVTFEDLLDLARSGVGSAVILAQIEEMGLDFKPTPRHLAALGAAGLDPEVLSRVVHDAGLAASAAAPRETVRIFRLIGEDGRARLVLTNLDDEGNPIRDPWEEEKPAAPPAPPPEPPNDCRAAEEEGSYEEPEAAPPQVTVNVQLPPGPQPWFSAPILVVGGVAGAYQYPKRLGFLGYGPGISSPAWFSGLGLNATNNYGLRRQDKPNTTGLNAFFGPPSR